MTLEISSQPIRLVISGGLAGPPGVGVAGVAMNAAGQLVFTLADGTVLAPVGLPTTITSVTNSISTFDGDPLLSVDGVEIDRIV